MEATIRNSAGSSSLWTSLRGKGRQGRAFTLVEMVVVIAIVILMVGLVVPAATQLWRDRKVADAQNLISGMLMTARARAIQSGGVETGLFFFVDDQGVQKVAPITQNPNDPAETEEPDTDEPKLVRGWESDVRWSKVFTVVRDRSFTMPTPMRIVPLYAICPVDQGREMCAVSESQYTRFSDDELNNNDLEAVTISGNITVAQAHRNFFTLIFAPNGEMKVGREVLIRDRDDEADLEEEEEGRGVVTGLRVQGRQETLVTQFFPYGQPTDNPTELAPDDTALPANLGPSWLVTDASGIAVNFPSIEGLLLYDDSVFAEAGDAEQKREYLRSFGLPFYINRMTGAVMRGPIGTTVATTP